MTFAVLCPGQGSQHAAMLDLIAGDPAAEHVLQQGESALGIHPREWLARPTEIFANAVAQPLLCLTELATWAALRHRIGEPEAFAGYSIGELAAYACAGALDAAELARLARARAEAMDAAAQRPGGVLGIRGLRRDEVDSLRVDTDVWIAIVIGEDAFVVGGDTVALDTFASGAAVRGGQIARLDVEVAAHTPLLRSAVEPFRSALEQSALRDPGIPVVAGVDASWVTSRKRAIATLAPQIAMTVEWASCLDALFERGCRVFLELGPGGALARMVQERFGDEAEARSVKEFRSLEAVAGWLQRWQR